MVRSMTGYGRSEVMHKSGKITVEISSTNRKHLELSLGLPKEFSFLENEFREMAAQYVKRGRVQVFIGFELVNNKVEFYLDVELAKRYHDALQELSDELELEQEITLKDILSNEEVLTFEKTPFHGEELSEPLTKVYVEAFQSLVEMREREGTALQSDILKRLSMIELKVKEIQSLSPLAVQRYEQKLRKKISELLPAAEGNEDRVIREVAIMAERLDITEEIVRLLSHIEQFEKSMESEDSMGRLLDFLTQEMVREINTIASKSSELDISRLAVEVKNELDKIREQIQNIE
jgi:uncharacterized protein (TIGR00255 family)